MTTSNPPPDTSRISISAHYTGYVWYRHQLSAAAFTTLTGRIANACLTPVNAFLRRVAGAGIDTFLLQRHLVLDHLIRQLIEQQGVEQIVEIAAGLSPRGYRFCQQYPQLQYTEADLPGMAGRKRRVLQQLQPEQRHRVRSCNILAESGDDSIAALLTSLDPQKKTLIITEGLVNYFELPVIRAVWARIAGGLKTFPQGFYLTDLYPDFADHPSYRYVKLAQKLVGFFTRGEWPLHYASDHEIRAGFLADGFSGVEVHDPADFYQRLEMPRARTRTLVRLIQAQA